MDGLAAGGHIRAPDYDLAWDWSVTNPEAFWTSVVDTFGVSWDREPSSPSQTDSVWNAAWFPGSMLNYAAHALRGRPGDLAIVARSQTRGPIQLTRGELADAVQRARGGLRRAGVGPGDRVAGYLPNVPEAVICLLACASIGAVWTACPPEMGAHGALERLAQVEPTVLVAVDGYRYGNRGLDRRAEVTALRASLPTVKTGVLVPYLDPEARLGDDWVDWDTFAKEADTDGHLPVAFDHPLYILYSSGTTGRPKGIVHGHGGILLEHLKALGWHLDLGPADRFCWYSTTGWMMWNFLVSGLAVGATVVLFDGDPTWPNPDALWHLAAETGLTYLGVGAGYLVAGAAAGREPKRDCDLSRLREIGSTGSPLPARVAGWVYGSVADDRALAPMSGGTDVCTAFVGGSPLHPVWAGEMACRWLGAKVEAFDATGHAVRDAEGELVVTAPMPSMPVCLWGDLDGARYRATYFEQFPGVWTHGDRVRLTSRGSVVISGRSDGTLNRGGVRMGTAEFYDVVEAFPEVVDSLAVHVDDPEGGPGTLYLFVVPAAGVVLDDELAARLRHRLRSDLSPRHSPDRIVAVPAVPRTLSGKKLEVPVKRLLMGIPLETAVTLSAVANPESLRAFVASSDSAGSAGSPDSAGSGGSSDSGGSSGSAGSSGSHRGGARGGNRTHGASSK